MELGLEETSNSFPENMIIDCNDGNLRIPLPYKENTSACNSYATGLFT